MSRLHALHQQEGHEGGIWACAWGSNSHLLTGSIDETVKAWEVTDAGVRFTHSYEGHALGAISVSANATGEVAASSALDSVIRIWHLHTHETLSLIETSATESWSIAFGPQKDALHLATAGGTRGAVVLWNVGSATGTGDTSVLAELQLPQASVMAQQVVQVPSQVEGGRAFAASAQPCSCCVFWTTAIR